MEQPGLPSQSNATFDRKFASTFGRKLAPNSTFHRKLAVHIQNYSPGASEHGAGHALLEDGRMVGSLSTELRDAVLATRLERTSQQVDLVLGWLSSLSGMQPASVEKLTEAIHSCSGMLLFHRDDVFKAGDSVDNIYFVLRGRIVLKDAKDGDQGETQQTVVVNSICAGEWFGEEDVLAGSQGGGGSRRVYSASSAENGTVLLRMPARVYRTCMEPWRTQWFAAKVNFLSQLPPLKPLSIATIRKLAPCFQLVKFRQRELLVRQGEVADAMYVIKEGKCGVIIDPTYKSTGSALADVEGSKIVQVCTLDHKAIIGDITVLSHVNKRTASVMALTAVQSYRIRRSVLLKHLQPDQLEILRVIATSKLRMTSQTVQKGLGSGINDQVLRGRNLREIILGETKQELKHRGTPPKVVSMGMGEAGHAAIKAYKRPTTAPAGHGAARHKAHHPHAPSSKPAGTNPRTMPASSKEDAAATAAVPAAAAAAAAPSYKPGGTNSRTVPLRSEEEEAVTTAVPAAAAAAAAAAAPSYKPGGTNSRTVPLRSEEESVGIASQAPASPVAPSAGVAPATAAATVGVATAPVAAWTADSSEPQQGSLDAAGANVTNDAQGFVWGSTSFPSSSSQSVAQQEQQQQQQQQESEEQQHFQQQREGQRQSMALGNRPNPLAVALCKAFGSSFVGRITALSSDGSCSAGASELMLLAAASDKQAPCSPPRGFRSRGGMSSGNSGTPLSPRGSSARPASRAFSGSVTLHTVPRDVVMWGVTGRVSSARPSACGPTVAQALDFPAFPCHHRATTYSGHTAPAHSSPRHSLSFSPESPVSTGDDPYACGRQATSSGNLLFARPSTASLCSPRNWGSRPSTSQAGTLPSSETLMQKPGNSKSTPEAKMHDETAQMRKSFTQLDFHLGLSPAKASQVQPKQATPEEHASPQACGAAATDKLRQTNQHFRPSISKMALLGT